MLVVNEEEIQNQHGDLPEKQKQALWSISARHFTQYELNWTEN